ncbi:MAG: CRISPR-associated helicase Cas3' [Acidilobaceae archaeon]|nr:CRISPR-associated helicase Cas3' [Acidilobaceae archaeon]
MCEPCGREKQLRDAIMKALSDGKKLIFVFAPTGYGKTRVSPYLLHAAREKGFASRLIHVVPTRALLEEIYEKKFKGPAKECGIHAAYQSLDWREGETKSPYFLAELVVTTLESFILNAFKLPPAEFTKVVEGSSEGHYYPSVSALLSSIVVFDEAHLYIAEAEGKPVALVVAAARALLAMNVPVVILTATMPLVQFEHIVAMLASRIDDVKVLYVCPAPGRCEQAEKMKKRGYDVEEMQDDQQRFINIEWKTRIMSYQDALKEAQTKCQNELVLWVSNTVKGAVEVFEVFDKLNKCERVLIHGRLSELDKEAAREKMRKLKGEQGDNHSSPCTSEKSRKEPEGELNKKAKAAERRGIIVASPIAEVGLDIDATILISEATSMESLVQRAGRLYREKESGTAEVWIYEKDIHEEESNAMKEIKREVIREIESYRKQGVLIDWRSPTSLGGRISYVELMEKIAEGRRADYSLDVSYAGLFEGIVSYDSRPRRALESVSDIESFGALLSLVKVKVGPGDKDYVIVSTNTLNPEWIEWETEKKVRVKVEAVVKGPDGKERREIYFSRVLGNMLRPPEPEEERKKGEKKKDRYMNIHHIRMLRDELLREGEERLKQQGVQKVYLTIRDYYLIGEKAYRRGRGLGVDVARGI